MFYRLLFIIFMLSSHNSFGQFLYEQQLRLLYKNKVPVMLPEKLNELLQAQAPVYLLDSRTPREFEVSHLKGATFVNHSSFNSSQVKNIPKNATVVVYCSVGVRSEQVGEKLTASGYTRVFNLYGGIFSWKNKGYSVVNSRQELTDSVHTYNRYWSVWLQNGTKVYE